MAVQQRIPTGDNALSNLVFSSGTTAYNLVDDPVGTPDDESTYVEASDAASGYAILNYSAFAITSSAVSKVSIFTRARRTGTVGYPTARAYLYFKDGGNNYVNGGSYLTAFTSITLDWLTNPVTGAAWTEQQVEGGGTTSQALDTKFRTNVARAGSGNVARLTQTYIEATYTEAASGPPKAVLAARRGSRMIGGTN